MPIAFNDPASDIVTVTPFDSRRGSGVAMAADQTSVASSGTWVTANRAVFQPVYIERPMSLVKVFWQNGSAVLGNVDCGIYTAAYALVASCGSTAQAGTATIQSASVTGNLQPGIYFIALVCSNAVTAAMARFAPTNARSYGAFQMGSAFPLPSTATPAALTNLALPLCGFTARSLI